MAETVQVAPEATTDKAKPAEGTVQQQGGVTRMTVDSQKTQEGQKAADKPTPTTPASSVVSAEDAAKKAGLDVAALEREYVENGQLSDESTKKLTDAGLTPEKLNEYVEGRKAVAAQTRTELAALVGGEATLDKALEWAKTGLSTDEIEAFNAAVTSGNKGIAKLAVQALGAQYAAVAGKDPQLVQAAEGKAAAGIQPFASQAELVRAMSDRRYKEGDVAYQKMVHARLAAG